jgi:hypothetical protein
LDLVTRRRKAKVNAVRYATPPLFVVCGFVLAGSLVSPATSAESRSIAVTAPMACTRGSGQQFKAVVTMPPTAPSGSTYAIRIDSFPSGKISHAGLNYLHAIETDYVLPAGVSYVEGSAHIVPDTGTENVRSSASAWHDKGVVRVYLPAHVKEDYTPPSVAFEVKVSAPPGSTLALKFAEADLTANVFLLGNLKVTCTPSPRPYTIGTTLVTPQ